MRGKHLAVQAAIVLTTVTFVSWPQFRPAVRVQSVWRYAPSTAAQTPTDDEAMYGDASQIRPTPVRLGQTGSRTQTDSGERASELLAARTFVTPDAVAALGGQVNALVGIARTSLNVPIPYAKVLLRNIRTGQVQARATADELGQFTFLDLDASSYIIELIGADGSVVAASPVVALMRGDLRQMEVRAAASATTIAASFGNALTATMPQATKVALSSDVTRTTTTLVSQESTR
jgi:hypothetical protein